MDVQGDVVVVVVGEEGGGPGVLPNQPQQQLRRCQQLVAWTQLDSTIPIVTYSNWCLGRSAGAASSPYSCSP